jgi:hypothetical protein
LTELTPQGGNRSRKTKAPPDEEIAAKHAAAFAFDMLAGKFLGDTTGYNRLLEPQPKAMRNADS